MQLISALFTIFLTTILPLGIFIYLIFKKDGYVKPFLIGVLTFTVFQVFTRIPLLQIVLPMTEWYNIMAYTQPILYALFLGFSAALFEEGGRFITMKLLMRNKRRFSDAVVFGIGHGGIEAILLVGINFIFALFYTDLLASASTGLILLSGVERLFAVLLHISWSVMVFYSIKARRPIYLAYAFLLHMLVDSGVVILQYLGLGILPIELVLIVITALSVFLALKLKKEFVNIHEANEIIEHLSLDNDYVGTNGVHTEEEIIKMVEDMVDNVIDDNKEETFDQPKEEEK